MQFCLHNFTYTYEDKDSYILYYKKIKGGREHALQERPHRSVDSGSVDSAALTVAALTARYETSINEQFSP